MSFPLTTPEAAILRRDGQFIMTNFIPLSFATIAWTTYLIMAYRAIRILCKNAIKDSRPRKIMLAATIAMFLLSTTQLLAFFGEFLVQVKTIMLESAPTLVERINNSKGLHGRFVLINTILLQLQVIIGDSIVVWRAWAIWGKRTNMIILPLILSVLSCISLIITTILAQHVSTSVRILIITQAISAATNAVATGLIGYKAWRHRQLLKSAFGRSKLATTQILQILILLVESGCIYLGIWLLDIIISVVAITTYGPWLITATTIDYVITQILGLYPTVIIILAEQRKTIWDDPAVSHVNSVLQFASSEGGGSHTDSDDQIRTISVLHSNPSSIPEGSAKVALGGRGKDPLFEFWRYLNE